MNPVPLIFIGNSCFKIMIKPKNTGKIPLTYDMKIRTLNSNSKKKIMSY